MLLRSKLRLMRLLKMVVLLSQSRLRWKIISQPPEYPALQASFWHVSPLALDCHEHSYASLLSSFSSASAIWTLQSRKPSTEGLETWVLTPTLPLPPSEPPGRSLHLSGCPHCDLRGSESAVSCALAGLGGCLENSLAFFAQAVEAGGPAIGPKCTGGGFEAELRLLQQQAALAALPSTHFLSHHG